MLRFDGLASDACARMPFANVGMARHSFGSQHLCALSSVGDIGLSVPKQWMDGASQRTMPMSCNMAASSTNWRSRHSSGSRLAKAKAKSATLRL